MDQKYFRPFVLSLITLTAVTFKTSAQDVLARSGFLSDSTQVGYEVRYFLSAQYPADIQVIFPDSTFNYSPFEFRKKKFFPTKTSQGVSYDSVVYYLTTYEIDRHQILKLPVFKINTTDSILFLSNADTLLIQQLVRSLPDSLTRDLPVRATIGYQKVSQQINYLLILIVVCLLLMIGVAISFMFGTRIQKYFQIKKMRRAHQQFIDTYNRQINELTTRYSRAHTEVTVGTWKKYMEKLDQRPYTKLTTRETLQIEKTDKIGKNLRQLDSAIYGFNTDVIEHLEQLRGFADERFSKKLEEINHE